MKNSEPTEIKLYRTRRILKYRKQRKSGDWANWPKKPYEVFEVSILPPAIYGPVWRSLTNRLNKLIEQDHQPYKQCSEATIQRLKYWGKVNKCKRKATKYGLTWHCLENKFFLEFLVLDLTDEETMTRKAVQDYLRKDKHTAGRRFRQLEADSKAMYRVAICIFKDGWFWLAGKTRPKEEKS
jgi:hypothetical protein